MTDTDALIVVKSAAVVKEGTSAKGPWKMYLVKSADDTKYATFEEELGETAKAAIGRRAAITYKVTDRGNELLTLEIEQGSAPVPVAQDERDWDEIGLRKTRCALWAACFRGGMGIDQARQAVIAAEVDIFHREPAASTDDIPF